MLAPYGLPPSPSTLGQRVAVLRALCSKAGPKPTYGFRLSPKKGVQKSIFKIKKTCCTKHMPKIRKRLQKTCKHYATGVQQIWVGLRAKTKKLETGILKIALFRFKMFFILKFRCLATLYNFMPCSSQKHEKLMQQRKQNSANNI